MIAVLPSFVWVSSVALEDENDSLVEFYRRIGVEIPVDVEGGIPSAFPSIVGVGEASNEGPEAGGDHGEDDISKPALSM